MLQYMAFSSLVVVVFLEEHNDLFIANESDTFIAR